MSDRPPTGPSTIGAMPRAAAILVYGSAAPIAALLAILAIGGVGSFTADDAIAALLSYAAALLTFHAGMACGQAIRAGRQNVRLGITVLLALAAWGTLLVPGSAGPLVLAALTAAQGALDVWSADGIRAPAWYGRLRAGATVITVVLLVAAFALAPR